MRCPAGRNSYVWRRMLALTVLVAGCVFVTSSVVALAVMMFAAGCLIAPTIAAVYERIGVTDADLGAHRDLRLDAERRNGRLRGRLRRSPGPWSRRSASATRGS